MAPIDSYQQRRPIIASLVRWRSGNTYRRQCLLHSPQRSVGARGIGGQEADKRRPRISAERFIVQFVAGNSHRADEGPNGIHIALVGGRRLI
ncbi:MAG: hypothetical protein K2Y33_03620 [Mycolicibacterium frederiksbergense]|uniref:hypothetical protein n=1 Tax=Mycobacterium adipatum TaxID=1682113 RepID=UPI0027E62F73|nr:hypothetical protein [Mycolicibacterium frederiksbergense]